MLRRFVATLAVGGILFASAPAEALQCVPFAREHSGISLRGDAWTWWSSAEGQYDRGHAPSLGAVVVFKKHGSMRHGHVAVVTKLINSRQVMVDHANWGSRRVGGRGRVARNMAVVDVSSANDWSAVRVWNIGSQDYGIRVYPTYGFIYPAHGGPRFPGAQGGATLQAVNFTGRNGFAPLFSQPALPDEMTEEVLDDLPDSDAKAPDARIQPAKAADGKPANAKGSEAKAAESKPVEVKAPEAKPAEVTVIEAKAAESKPVETKAAEAKPAEAKAVEAKAAESKPVETKAAEAKPTEAKAVEAKAAESKPVGAKPAESRLVVAKAVESKPAPEARPAAPATVASADGVWADDVALARKFGSGQY